MECCCSLPAWLWRSGHGTSEALQDEQRGLAGGHRNPAESRARCPEGCPVPLAAWPAGAVAIAVCKQAKAAPGRQSPPGPGSAAEMLRTPPPGSSRALAVPRQAGSCSPALPISHKRLLWGNKSWCPCPACPGRLRRAVGQKLPACCCSQGTCRTSSASFQLLNLCSARRADQDKAGSGAAELFPVPKPLCQHFLPTDTEDTS